MADSTALDRLALNAKRGCERSFERLLSSMEGKMVGIARRIGPHAVDDLMQEASLVLFEATQSFDPVRDVPFEPFALKLIGWRLRDVSGQYRTMTVPSTSMSIYLSAMGAAEGDYETARILARERGMTHGLFDSIRASEATVSWEEVA